MVLTGKNILLISPEPWNHIFVSKHHYAVHLAKRGNRVFFLNPPSPKRGIRVEPAAFDNLWIVSYSGFISGLRFLPGFVQRIVMRLVLDKIEGAANVKFNIIWSFDNSVFFNFTSFPKDTLTISHIVDPSQNFNTKTAASTAQICICNTDLLKERLLLYNKKVFKINHGYNEVKNVTKVTLPGQSTIKVVYCGNLNIPYIDWALLYQLVVENTDVDFVFIGPGFDLRPLGEGILNDMKQRVKGSGNVYAVGTVSSEIVAAHLQAADILLICYQEKYQRDQAANTHKMMEYLGAGKVIVATYTKEFESHKDDIVVMVEKNASLPLTFQHVIKNVSCYNRMELVERRIAVAKDNMYDRQIDRIDRILQDGN